MTSSLHSHGTHRPILLLSSLIPSTPVQTVGRGLRRPLHSPVRDLRRHDPAGIPKASLTCLDLGGLIHHLCSFVIGRMDTKPRDSGDFLDSVVHVDDTQYEQGFNEGYNDGLVSGKEEGKEVGLKVGFEVGEELGFYRGCVDVWKAVIRVDPGAFSSRLQKSIEQLGELVGKYPLSEPENEQIQEMMDAIRLKFKLISANLGVKLEYEGYPKSSKQELEDI